MARADPEGTLLAQLIASGHLIPMHANGLYGRSRSFEQLVTGLEGIVRAADPNVDREVTFPPVLPRQALEQSGYVRSFPDMIGVVSTFEGGNVEHATLMQTLGSEPPGGWGDLLTPSGTALCSAACHPLYASLRGQNVQTGITIQLTGWVFRNEPSVDPARMQSFRQRESVYLGLEAGALEHRNSWLARASKILDSLGLATQAVVANDPFFGRVGRMLASAQLAAAAKWELVFPLSGDAPTALASANLHGTHFGEAFDVKSGTEPAHTACVGFGVERIAIAVMSTHGTDPQHWPEVLMPPEGWSLDLRR